MPARNPPVQQTEPKEDSSRLLLQLIQGSAPIPAPSAPFAQRADGSTALRSFLGLGGQPPHPATLPPSLPHHSNGHMPPPAASQRYTNVHAQAPSPRVGNDANSPEECARRNMLLSTLSGAPKPAPPPHAAAGVPSHAPAPNGTQSPHQNSLLSMLRKAPSSPQPNPLLATLNGSAQPAPPSVPSLIPTDTRHDARSPTDAPMRPQHAQPDQAREWTQHPSPGHHTSDPSLLWKRAESMRSPLSHASSAAYPGFPLSPENTPSAAHWSLSATSPPARHQQSLLSTLMGPQKATSPPPPPPQHAPAPARANNLLNILNAPAPQKGAAGFAHHDETQHASNALLASILRGG